MCQLNTACIALTLRRKNRVRHWLASGGGAESVLSKPQIQYHRCELWIESRDRKGASDLAPHQAQDARTQDELLPRRRLASVRSQSEEPIARFAPFLRAEPWS
jgi:hypothetical protein